MNTTTFYKEAPVPPIIFPPPLNQRGQGQPKLPPLGWLGLIVASAFIGYSLRNAPPPSLPSPAPVPVATPAPAPPMHFDYAPRAKLIKMPPLRFTDGTMLNLSYRGSLGNTGDLPRAGNHMGDTFYVNPNWWIWLGTTNGWVDP